MAGTLTRLGLPLALSLALAAGAAAAGGDLDPTRPPAASPVAAAGSQEAAAAETKLQAVFRPKGGRAAALINGERVPLGGKIGEEKLVRVREGEVVLRGPEGERHLLLVPAVSMKPTADTPRAGHREKKHEAP